MLYSVAFLTPNHTIVFEDGSLGKISDCYRTDWYVAYNNYRIDFEDGSHIIRKGNDKVFITQEKD